MPTNDERADWAFAACEEFAEATDLDLGCELDTAIGDLIANLLHLADSRGFCAETLWKRGKMHYDAEIADETS